MTNLLSYVDDLEIIHSAQIHSGINKTIKINFGDIKVEIGFSVDSNLSRKINWKIDDEILKIIFENYLQPSGSGILEPWRIGHYNNKELFLTIFLKPVGESSISFILVDYIFYLGKEVKND